MENNQIGYIGAGVFMISVHDKVALIDYANQSTHKHVVLHSFYDVDKSHMNHVLLLDYQGIKVRQ